MSFTIKQSVFAHSYLNTPSKETSCDIDIILVNSNGTFTIEKEAVEQQTRLMLTVKNPKAIGLTDRHHIREESLRNLILAFNFSLKNNCLNIIEENLHGSEILRTSNSNASVTTKGSQGIMVNMGCEISTSVHITLGGREELDERTALLIYNGIKKFDRFKFKSSTLKEVNVAKALNEFETAMLPIDRLKVFRSLYNCLELCANSMGTKKENSALDAEISSLSGISQTTAEFWRLFYNRIKHPDTNNKQTVIYREGIEKLTVTLPEIRSSSTNLLLRLLD